jgi:hypothetical protein
MKGDFARLTFDPMKHFSRVLQQQGRAQVDADWNEQGAIALHLLRSLVIDLVGPTWRPDGGFLIGWDAASRDLTISKGHFYLDGILCENDAETTWSRQPWRPDPEHDPVPGVASPAIVYLEAWERHVTRLEDPGLEDPALGGVDTATRAQLLWQVRVLDPAQADAQIDGAVAALLRRIEHAATHGEEAEAARLRQEAAETGTLKNLVARRFTCDVARKILGLGEIVSGRLRARARGGDDGSSLLPGYRGTENRLYRIEIHDAGLGDGAATFKWSRDNGSVVFPVAAIGPTSQGSSVILKPLVGRSRAPQTGEWIEYEDNDSVMQRAPRPLARVLAADETGGQIEVGAELPPPGPDRHPRLRRWDQRRDVTASGVVSVSESGRENGWIELEDGVQVQFQPGGLYRNGDYWVIPARTATANIEWPRDNARSSPKPLPPHGIERHVAPLAILRMSGAKAKIVPCPCGSPFRKTPNGRRP